VEAQLAARRAALGLEEGALPFAAAMKAIETRDLEAFLGRLAARQAPPAKSLDRIVMLESLLRRADPSTAGEYRMVDPRGFDAAVRRTRSLARELAVALVLRRPVPEAARMLAKSCRACHLMVGRPR